MATAAMRTAPKKRKAPVMAEIDASVVRELATHAADINHMQEDMDKVLAEMAQMRICLNKISATLSEARGGWKILMLLGGAAGVLGAMITHFIAATWGK